MTTRSFFAQALALFAGVMTCLAGSAPPPQHHDYIIKDFQFASGDTMPELRMHYVTFGTPQRDERGNVNNAVLILHGTTGSSAQFLGTNFADVLFSKGGVLDASRYFIVLRDGIGHGRSSKPSDGLRAKFPHYRYRDMVEADYRLLTEGLGIKHLRLVMGTSMGGMHTWVWGEAHPDFMDALMPLACLPTEISGRNRVWRRMIIDSIRGDPGWENGDYKTQPNGTRVAHEVLYYIGSNPTQRLKEAPTLQAADAKLDDFVAMGLKRLDANDVLYALQASEDYNPAPALETIRARVLAVNFADDLINPPELGVLEREIKRVKHGKAILMPETEHTRGHGTHTIATVWQKQLAWLLKKTAP